MFNYYLSIASFSEKWTYNLSFCLRKSSNIRKLQTDDLQQVPRKSRPRTGDVDLHQGASGAACGGDRFGVEAGSDALAIHVRLKPWSMDQW